MLDTSYRNTRARVHSLIAGLADHQLRAPVPATPDWTVHDLLAHLAGGAADAVAGRLDGAPGTEWTARHVAERRNRPIGELLDEWEAVGPVVEAHLASQPFTGANSAADALCHEADLHEALGLPRPGRDHWQPFLDAMGHLPGRGLRDTATLLIRDELGQQWRGGSGESVITLHADGYELFRGLFSRRSRRQIAAWDWSAAPTAQLMDDFGVFGYRDDDQPIPVR